VNQKAAALVQKLGVTAQDNETSQGMVQQADEKRATLEKLSGPAFDKAYIANEAGYHRVIDDALRDTLIPAASNAELRDFLQTSLKMFEGHQQSAEKIAQDLDKPVKPHRRAPKPKQT
jgi:putative membrane protein